MRHAVVIREEKQDIGRGGAKRLQSDAQQDGRDEDFEDCHRSFLSTVLGGFSNGREDRLASFGPFCIVQLGFFSPTQALVLKSEHISIAGILAAGRG
jgi:hypothetical protein